LYYTQLKAKQNIIFRTFFFITNIIQSKPQNKILALLMHHIYTFY